jgi:hypothetical protein
MLKWAGCMLGTGEERKRPVLWPLGLFFGRLMWKQPSSQSAGPSREIHRLNPPETFHLEPPPLSNLCIHAEILGETKGSSMDSTAVGGLEPHPPHH